MATYDCFSRAYFPHHSCTYIYIYIHVTYIYFHVGGRCILHVPRCQLSCVLYRPDVFGGFAKHKSVCAMKLCFVLCFCISL